MTPNNASSVIHIGLTTRTLKLSTEELQRVAASLSKQVARDFAPIWGIHATVSAFSNPASLPNNYWPVMVADNINEPGAAGYHSDSHNQPFSLVQMSPDWSTTASHEVLEMIADPFGNRLVGGIIGGRQIRALKEMCDPCEAFTYLIDGVKVSDFLLPEYYGVAKPGAHYSFLNSLKGPFTVAKGGYLSYIDDDRWKQIQFWGGLRPKTVDLGSTGEKEVGMSLREWVDMRTRNAKEKP